jgi:IS4 transposase
MIFDEILARFVRYSPITAMAQLGFERVFEGDWVDQVFEDFRERQYHRELLFSTTVDIMALVALGVRPSVHAAARSRESLGVSLSALYEKINHTEPALARALVAESFRRVTPLVEHLTKTPAPACPGYKTRIVDGNCLAPSEKRLKPLRKVRSAALPGRSLVVYDPDLALVVDVLPCEDGHAGERTLMASLVEEARPGELWIGDRNFCTGPIIAAWQSKGCAFLVREHASNARLVACGPLEEMGSTETGVVYEQPVDCELPDGVSLRLRRIEIRLYQRTSDGETVINLVTNLPTQVSALDIATLYRRRWRIENMFQKLESVLHSEVRTLGYPRAALFSFCVAIVAYNVLSMIQTAVEAEHRVEPRSSAELSLFALADEIKSTHKGMMIAILPEQWTPLRTLPLDAFCAALLQIAANVNPARFRKKPRGPKKDRKRKSIPPSLAGAHVSTGRLLQKRRRRAGS